jgi:hypothetical protein
VVSQEQRTQFSTEQEKRLLRKLREERKEYTKQAKALAINAVQSGPAELQDKCRAERPPRVINFFEVGYWQGKTRG